MKGILKIISATINLNNVNELSIQDFTVTIDENPSYGQSLGIVQATGDGTLSFSITSQIQAGALSIDAGTGELTVTDSTLSLFNFETNPVITATVSVGNSVSIETAIVSINLNDLNEIGEFKYGGVIFWLDPSDNNHGLVCAVRDDDTFPITEGWGCQGTNIAGAVEVGIGQDQVNTTAILASCSTTGIAADLASNSSYGGYTDWFSPSRDALSRMCSSRHVINNTAVLNGGYNFAQGYYYWSSTQNDSNTAWALSFSNGLALTPKNKESSVPKVRVVRAF